MPPEASADELLDSLGLRRGDVLDGKFRIDEVVGMGGMSVVLRATHVALEATVALKVLHPRLRDDRACVERFAREARTVVKIENDHVARVYDVGQLPAGPPYMVMEYLRGGDLGQRINRSEPIAIDEAVGWIIEACEGLAEAHSRGLVHRDIKPENLFVVTRSDGRSVVKLLDFGISREISAADGAARLVAKGKRSTFFGTPLYMSPEQMRGDPLDHKTDIWSLGVVLYELLTRLTPFPGDNLSEIISSVLIHAPPVPSKLRPEIPPLLDEVVMRCLRRNPEERFESVAALAQALLPLSPHHHREQVGRIVRVLGAAAAAPIVCAPPTRVHDAREATTLAAASRSWARLTPLIVAAAIGAFALVMIGNGPRPAQAARTWASANPTLYRAAPAVSKPSQPKARPPLAKAPGIVTASPYVRRRAPATTPTTAGVASSPALTSSPALATDIRLSR